MEAEDAHKVVSLDPAEHEVHFRPFHLHPMGAETPSKDLMCVQSVIQVG